MVVVLYTVKKMVSFFRCLFFAGGVWILLSSCAPRQAQTDAEPVVHTASMEKDILYYVNRHRESIGKPALTLLSEASLQAYKHSRNMANGKTAFGHDGFDQRMQQIKKSFGWISASAENVAYGQLSAREVVNGWLNSPGHRRNIEGDYRYTGIGFYQNKKGVIYFTQLFLRK